MAMAACHSVHTCNPAANSFRAVHDSVRQVHREKIKVQGEDEGAGRRSRCREKIKVQGEDSGAGRRFRCREKMKVQGGDQGAGRRLRCREKSKVQGEDEGAGRSSAGMHSPHHRGCPCTVRRPPASARPHLAPAVTLPHQSCCCTSPQQAAAPTPSSASQAEHASAGTPGAECRCS